MNPLALYPSTGLSGYAQAVETAPVTTLTLTGAMVGGLWGILLGYGAALAFKKDKIVFSTAAGITGAVILGAEGYRQGTELQQWLAQY